MAWVSATRRRAGEGVVVRTRLGAQPERAGLVLCSPGFQAQVWSPTDHRTIRKTFRSLADARAWRAEALTGLRRGVIRAPTRTTLDQEAESWLALAKGGTIRTRSGDTYKPSALRSYEQSLRTLTILLFVTDSRSCSVRGRSSRSESSIRQHRPPRASRQRSPPALLCPKRRSAFPLA